MQAIYETESLLDEIENPESDSSMTTASSGARRVWRLALIVLFLLGVAALLFFVLLPMIQPPLPALAPALQV